MSNKKTDKSVSISRGKRLQEIREFRKKTDKRNIGRRKKIWSREDVAEKMGVNEQTIKDYEKGRNIIDEGVAKNYAKLYKCPIDFIMGDDDDMLGTNNFNPLEEDDPVSLSDRLIIELLESMGVDIYFAYIPYFLKEANRPIRVLHEDEIIDTELTSIRELENFSLSDYKCYLIDKKTDTRQSIIIKDVFIRSNRVDRMTFYQFAFFITELKDDLLGRIKRLDSTLAYHKFFNGNMKYSFNKEIADVKNGFSNIPRDKENISDLEKEIIEKEFGEGTLLPAEQYLKELKEYIKEYKNND